MKVTVKEKESDITYPCLMMNKSNNSLIVLFIEEKTGIHLTDGLANPAGHFAKTYSQDCYVAFTGTITLSND